MPSFLASDTYTVRRMLEPSHLRSARPSLCNDHIISARTIDNDFEQSIEALPDISRYLPG
jgi:hypothetical protein